MSKSPFQHPRLCGPLTQLPGRGTLGRLSNGVTWDASARVKGERAAHSARAATRAMTGGWSHRGLVPRWAIPAVRSALSGINELGPYINYFNFTSFDPLLPSPGGIWGWRRPVNASGLVIPSDGMFGPRTRLPVTRTPANRGRQH